MGKAAGIWKKVKRVAKTIGNKFGKALSWANENIFKPGGGYIKPIIEVFDPSGLGSRIYDGVTNVISNVSDRLGYKPEGTWAPVTQQIGDVMMDTQRIGDEKKYKDPFQTAIKVNDTIHDAVERHRTLKDLRKIKQDVTGGDPFDDDGDDGWGDLGH